MGCINSVILSDTDATSKREDKDSNAELVLSHNKTATDATGKQKRGEDEVSFEDLADGLQNVMQFSEHPEDDDEVSFEDLADGLQQVMKFLERPDRLMLAVTCQTARESVENYSRAALVRIAQNHVLDDSFPKRLRAAAARAAPAGGAVPQRRLLQAAYGIHLCRLKMFMDLRGKERPEVAFSNDGSRLVMAVFARGIIMVCIWRLEDKTLEQTIEETSRESESHKVYCWISSQGVENFVICTNTSCATWGLSFH